MSGCGCKRSTAVGKLAKEAVTHATGNEAVGSVAEGIVSAASCKTNANFIYAALIGGFTAIGGMMATITSFFSFNKTEKLPSQEYPADGTCNPLDLSQEDFLHKNSATIIEAAAKMEGTTGSDLMVAFPEGSKIFSINGTDYLVAGPGEDQFYFSLRSTAEVDVIEGFDPKMDKIFFFFSENEINPENVSIYHQKQDDIDLTFIKVQGNEKTSVIALLGNIEITTDDIVLNQRWEN